MSAETMIVEINGVKLEVDMRHAKIVTENIMADVPMTLEQVRDLLRQAPATSMIGSYVALSVPDVAAAVHAIESAIAEHGKVREWQPIETAPKGKAIIGAWMGAPGCHEVATCIFNPSANYWCQVDDWCAELCAPDFWMPLPAAPKVTP